MKNNGWIVKIFIMTFILSIIFSTISNVITSKVSNVFIIGILLILVIAIGILFDAIGTSSLTANEAAFHAMNSQKIKGAKETLTLIKNNSQISTICNDVVGDVCGIISGSLGTILAIGIHNMTGISNTLISVIIAALISALTVGGKAIFKRIALKKANTILFSVGKVKNILHLK